MEILRNIGIMGGSPNIDNRRINVFNVLTILQSENGLGRLSMEFFIAQEDVEKILTYCKNKRCQLQPQYDYCEGCILETERNQPIIYNESTFAKIDEIDVFISKNQNIIYLGTKEELAKEGYEKGWEIAETLYDIHFPSSP